MAQRAQQKSKPGSARQKPVASSAAGGRELEDRLKSLERERDELKASLEAARDRITALEESRSQIANRIDWVIDSLQTLVENSD